MEYPFRPKSNRHLRAGQFWAIPLDGGRFACGRVMAATSVILPRAGFIAGLMDWIGDSPPADEDLAGLRVIAQGGAHVKTITETGGEILGCRPLEADGLAAAPENDELGDWGYRYILRLAERHLAGF